MRTNRFFLLLLLALAVVAGCGGGGGGKTDGGVSVTISPGQVILSLGEKCQFAATVSGTGSTGVIWSTDEAGSVTPTGLYTAPSTAGTYYVKATSKADPAKSAQATVTVVSGAASGNKYTGTITIRNTGTMDNLTMDQSATLVVALGSPEAPFTHYDNSFYIALVSASINDTTGEDPVVTITGSLTSAVMNSPDLAVVLEINETTYDLNIGSVPVDCVWTGIGNQLYYVIGRVIEGCPLPANQSRITGSITSTVEGLPGITQEINWDLVLIK